MKHLLQTTLTAALLTAALSGQAQSQAQKEHGLQALLSKIQHRGPAARGVNSITVPGREVSHYWDDQTNRWGNGLVVSRTYNGQGQPLQVISMDSATSQPYARETYTYNAQGLVAEVVNQIWTGSAYTNSIRKQHTYNAQGQETQELQQEWTGSAYVNKYRYQYAYDARGEQTLYLNQEWLNNAWTTRYGYRDVHTYNTAGVRTSTVSEEWDTNTNSWQLEYRVLFTLNANNQWTEVLEQGWDAATNAYVNEDRTRNITWHNWALFQPASYEEQEWDDNAGAWSEDSRTNYTYQSNGSYGYVTQSLTAPNVWVNDSRWTVTRDNNGNLILEQGEYWDNGSWVIEEGYRNILSYTAANLLRRNASQRYNEQLRRYVNSYVSTYGNFVTLANRRATGLEAAAALYPNPTLGTATFSLKGLRQQAPVQAEVLNGLGQVVRTFAVPVQQGRIEQEISLTGQPAGVYTLRLHTVEGVVARRVVKQ